MTPAATNTTVVRPVRFAVKGRRKRAIAGGEPEPTVAKPTSRVPRVSILMALAIKYDRLLRDGVVESQTELARLAHVTQPRMTQILNLLHLAPDIQEWLLFLPEVTDGRDPVTEKDLRIVAKEVEWGKQRSAGGFARLA